LQIFAKVIAYTVKCVNMANDKTSSN